MAQSRSDRRSRQRPAVKPAECPCVADLIDFAEGRADPEDRRRIETHLESTSCPHCRGWIAKATATLPPDPPAANPGPARLLPDSAKWQRQAFLDLQQRLKELEDS